MHACMHGQYYTSRTRSSLVAKHVIQFAICHPVQETSLFSGSILCHHHSDYLRNAQNRNGGTALHVYTLP